MIHHSTGKQGMQRTSTHDAAVYNGTEVLNVYIPKPSPNASKRSLRATLPSALCHALPLLLQSSEIGMQSHPDTRSKVVPRMITLVMLRLEL